MTTESEDARPAALCRLATPETHDPIAEDRVVQTLTARGLLRTPSLRQRFRGTWWIGMAAALMGFVTGRLTTRSDRPAPGPSPQWMLLLYEDAAFRGPPPGQEQTYVEEYGRWAATLAADQRLVSGGELRPGGLVLNEPGQNRPVAEATPLGSLTGYFLITAPTLAQAQSIASGCPHLLHGGSIVIRPVS